jgi:hypothetical protein
MTRKNSQTPARNFYLEAESRSAARRAEWVLDAMRHLFEGAMADRRS